MVRVVDSQKKCLAPWVWGVGVLAFVCLGGTTPVAAQSSRPSNPYASFPPARAAAPKPAKKTYQKVTWASLTFAQALQQAKKRKCPIFLDMYATWCRPCKRYDREVFIKSKVATFMHQNFVLLRRNGYQGEGRLLARRFNCVTYPCLLVIDDDGQEIERITRFLPARSLLSRLKQIRKGVGTLESLQKRLQQKPNDALLRYRVGFRLAYRGQQSCIKHLRYVSQKPPAGYSWLAPKALYVLGRIYYRNTLRDCANAIKVFQEYLRRFPSAKRTSRVRRLMYGCMRRLQRRR